jgi:hypothetical protein
MQEQDPFGDLPHVQIVMNDGPNPLTWDAQLLSYWFRRNSAVFQDSVLRHREVGRAKDLSAPPRKHTSTTKPQNIQMTLIPLQITFETVTDNCLYRYGSGTLCK